jgi:hypothetical protein
LSAIGSACKLVGYYYHTYSRVNFFCFLIIFISSSRSAGEQLIFFLGLILCYSQSGDHPQEDFSQIWLQPKYENKNLKTSFSYFWLPA